jgi:hypothetical protein
LPKIKRNAKVRNVNNSEKQFLYQNVNVTENLMFPKTSEFNPYSKREEIITANIGKVCYKEKMEQ